MIISKNKLGCGCAALELQSDNIIGGGNEAGSLYKIRYSIGLFNPFGRCQSCTAEEIEKLEVLRLNGFYFLPANCDILGGSVTVIINSSIRKEFQIPPQKFQWPNIDILATADSQ
jgi:hypothetical protein